MKVLAFDASTDWLSVAAGDDAGVVAREELARNAHAERMLPRIREVLSERGWKLGDLDAIAFGAGPGAFTGVRIACGIAQGLALGTGIPVLAVGTLEAIAESAWQRNRHTRIVAAIDARMREIYVAAYVRGDGTWECVAEPAVLKPDAATAPPGRWTGAGDAFNVYPALAAHLGLASLDEAARPSARAILALADGRIAAGQGVAARDALPVYVRHRVALTSVERDAGLRL